MAWTPILTTKKTGWKPILTVKPPAQNIPVTWGTNTFANPMGGSTAAAPAPSQISRGQVAQQAGQMVGGFAAATAQAVPRTILSTALTVAPGTVRQNIGQINPQQDLGKFGTFALGSQPVTSLQQAALPVNEALQTGLTNVKTGQKPPELLTNLMTAGGLAGLAVADLTGFGGSRKTFLGMLQKADNVADVATVMRQGGFSDDVILRFASDIAATKDRLKIEKAIQAAETLQTATKRSASPQNIANVDAKRTPATQAGWPTTASKQSTAGNISTGSAPTGKGGVSAQKAGTSGPFDGVKVYRASLSDDPFNQKNFRTDSTFGNGMFFTDKEHIAKLYGANPKEAYVTIKKPFVITEKTPDDAGRVNVANSFGGPQKFREMLEREGYDGIIVDGPYGGKEYFPFKAAQISSPSIPKELEPLAAEARKYGSRLDFIDRYHSKAQGVIDPDGKTIRIYTKDADGKTLPTDEITRRARHELAHLADFQGRTQKLVVPPEELDAIFNYRYRGTTNNKVDITFKIDLPNKDLEVQAYARELFATDPNTLKKIAPNTYEQITGGTPKGDRPFNQATSQTSAGTARTETLSRPELQPQQKQAPPPDAPPRTSPSPAPAPKSDNLSYSSNKAQKSKLVEPTGRTAVEEATYQANRAKQKTTKTQLIKREIGAALSSTRQGLDKLLGPISTRLKNIDPSLKKAMRDYEFKVANATQKDRKAVESFLTTARSMDDADYADLDLALKNGDAARIKELSAKYGLDEELAEVRATLDDLWERAKAVGYDIGYQKNYFPRMINDAEGFLAHLQKGDDWSIIDEAIRTKETELSRYLTVHEKANLINTLVRGYKTAGITLSETGAMKARRIDIIDAELNQFYRDSSASLLRYIDDTNEAIEARRFFGKAGKENEFANLDDSVGAYILDLIAKGLVNPSQEVELRNMLQARFNQMGATGVIKVYKNLSYIDTMGSVISAVTQLGDLAFAVYKGGLSQTVKAFSKALVGRSEITRADIGIEKIAQEFEDGSRSANAVNMVFRLVGLQKMDALGKETVINATLGRFRKLAQNPTDDFMRRLEGIFGNDPATLTRVLDDLKAGKTTEDTKLIAFNELLDVQPVALSEMPEQYLKGGNGRIFYMLKTYTVKLFDVYRNDVYHEMVRDPVKGVRNLLYLTGALIVMNATADEIKDFMLGRETSLKDRTVDNILKLVGFSKFTIYKAREEGIGSAVSRTILPPFKFIDSLYKDITQMNSLNEMETIQSIPIGGKLYYWWVGKGASKSEKARQAAEREASGLTDLQKADAEQSADRKAQAEKLWQDIKALPPDEARTRLKALKTEDEELHDRVVDIAQADKMGLEGIEASLKTSTVNVRAQYILKELDGKTPEEKRALLDNYKSKKILTDSVLKRMKELKTEQQGESRLTDEQKSAAARKAFEMAQATSGGAMGVAGLARSVASKLSPKIASAAETMRDMLIKELSTPQAVQTGKQLNLKLMEEAEEFINFLKQTKTPTMEEMNSGLEILRLQGKNVTRLTDQVIKSAQEGVNQLRDTIGRFASPPRGFSTAQALGTGAAASAVVGAYVLEESHQRAFAGRVRDKTLSTTPFTPEARKQLETAIYDVVTSNKGTNLADGKMPSGTYSGKGDNFHNAVVNVVGPFSKKATNWVLKNTRFLQKMDRANIKVLTESPEVMAHEMLHHLFEYSDMGPLNDDLSLRGNAAASGMAFIDEWEMLEPNYPVLKEVKEHIEEDYDVTNLDGVGWATEMFAYLGERAAIGRLNDIPPELRKYYSNVFDFGK